MKKASPDVNNEYDIQYSPEAATILIYMCMRETEEGRTTLQLFYCAFNLYENYSEPVTIYTHACAQTEACLTARARAAARRDRRSPCCSRSS